VQSDNEELKNYIILPIVRWSDTDSRAFVRNV